uniref:Oxidoreductase FAD/NAD(P)-binding domain-containing protein n=1 Tax=Alexandrium monilatum TaxID=311494 RepID=A0A7S4QPQ1_9DINO
MFATSSPRGKAQVAPTCRRCLGVGRAVTAVAFCASAAVAWGALSFTVPTAARGPALARGVRREGSAPAGWAGPTLGGGEPARSRWTSSALCGLLTLAAASVAASVAALQARTASARAPRRGWGDDVVFHEASVQSNVEAAQGLRLITIKAPAEVSGVFAKPGQFVQAKPAADAKPSFYAISSPPGSEDPLEFLIKEAESNAWLTGAKSGDAVQLSPAMGRGFDLACEAWDAAEVSQVGLFAAGSGIAPIRATIESGALEGKVARLYFGAQSEASMPFTDRFEDWTQRGVEVVPVLSKPDGSWTGRSGYVQDALKEDEERGEGFVLAARHGALLCGQKEMVAAVRSVYADLGVPEERTLLNF